MKNRFIDIHTHKRYDDGTIFILSQAVGRDAAPPSGMLFSAGVHPWDADSADIGQALEYLSAAPVAAIGEIGLDYAADIDRDSQKEVFNAQLKIAERRDMPVVIHCVRAYNDVLSKLKDCVLPGVVFHGYTGSPEQTAGILKRGYYLSFGARSLSSPKTVESLRSAPLDRIFAETDDSCEDIFMIYSKISDLIKVPLEVLQDNIYDNFKRIFK